MEDIKTEHVVIPNIKNLFIKYPEEVETWKAFSKLYGIFGWDLDTDVMTTVGGIPLLNVPAVTPTAELERKPSPEEFLTAMTAIKDGTCYNRMYDEEDQHIDADRLMCQVLRSLGYGDGVAIFCDMPRWYA